MAIIPTVRVSRMAASLAFYTEVLDFERGDDNDAPDDPSFQILTRDGDYLFLSSHRGDGEYGQAVAVFVADVGAVFQKFRERGLKTPGNPDAPQMVHGRPNVGYARVLCRRSGRQHAAVHTGTVVGSDRAYSPGIAAAVLDDR